MAKDDDFMGDVEETQAEEGEDQQLADYANVQNLDTVMTKQLIDVKLPAKLDEHDFTKYIKQNINLAAKSNFPRVEKKLHLGEYDLLSRKYKIFIAASKYDPDFFMVDSSLRWSVSLQLDKSVDGRLMELSFTKKLDIIKRHIRTGTEKARRFVLGRKEES